MMAGLFSRAIRRRPPILVLALLASALLHLFAIFGQEVDLSVSPDLAPLEARLIRTAPAAKLGPRPAVDQPPNPPKPKKKPPQVPEKPVTEIRDETKLPEPEPPPPAQPEPEKVVEAEPEPEVPPLPEAPEAVGTPWPKAGRITFALLMGEQRFQMGRSVHQWEIGPDNTYRIHATTEPTGLAAIPWFKPESVYWESRGKILANGLQPERFTERKSVKGITALGELDWQNKVVTLGGVHRFALPERAQDLLSLFYQLGYPGAGDISILPIVTGKRVEAYHFELLGTQDLALPFGQTWRTQHIRARYGQNEVTEVWTAVEQFGLPVQIRLVDRKGVVYYLQATEVMVSPEAATGSPVLPGAVAPTEAVTPKTTATASSPVTSAEVAVPAQPSPPHSVAPALNPLPHARPPTERQN